jgi:hypothetical protein
MRAFLAGLQITKMKKRVGKGLWITFVASIAGTLFAGFLTLRELITKKCFFGEVCPEFLGYPTCFFGLVLFAAIFVVSLILLLGKKTSPGLLNVLLLVSIAGVLFSTHFSAVEFLLPYCGKNLCKYTLLLPTCVYGFITFVITLIGILMERKKNK